jgi:hypothetical protein
MFQSDVVTAMNVQYRAEMLCHNVYCKRNISVITAFSKCVRPGHGDSEKRISLICFPSNIIALEIKYAKFGTSTDSYITSAILVGHCGSAV